jgi:DNA repair protein RecO
MLQPRNTFRNDWRAMQSASYISALFNYTTPDEAPQPGLFELYEELLDGAEEYGNQAAYIFWAEQRFCAYHGHAPNLGNCNRCNASEPLAFSAAAGGLVCRKCIKSEKLPYFECPQDLIAILKAWQKTDQPQVAVKIQLSEKQQQQLTLLSTTFMQHHFNLKPEHRNAVATF